MSYSGFDIDRTIAVSLYAVKKLEVVGRNDFHTIFKVLYFADQKHLVKFGRPILDDNYIALKHGPVPSYVYDCFKSLKFVRHTSEEVKKFQSNFKLYDNMLVAGITEPNMDYISKAQIKCLIESIEENKTLDFSALTHKSHDTAWQRASFNDVIDLVEIAIAGGANEEMIKYITSVQENTNLNFI